METVSIQIPAALYAAIYARYEEETGNAISGCLNRLLGPDVSKPHLPRTGTPVYPRPGRGTITGKVWEIADRLFEEAGETDRVSVVKACLREGINPNTANTQFSHWKNSETNTN